MDIDGMISEKSKEHKKSSVQNDSDESYSLSSDYLQETGNSDFRAISKRVKKENK